MTNEQRMRCSDIINSQAHHAADNLKDTSGDSFARAEKMYAADMVRQLKPIADIELDRTAEEALCTSILNKVRTQHKAVYVKASGIGHLPFLGKMRRNAYYTIFETLGWEIADQLYLLKMKEGAAETSDC